MFEKQSSKISSLMDSFRWNYLNNPKCDNEDVFCGAGEFCWLEGPYAEFDSAQMRYEVENSPALTNVRLTDNFQKGCLPNELRPIYGNTDEDVQGGISDLLEPFRTCQNYEATGLLPAAFDWRNVEGENWMTPVKDQRNVNGDTSTCWMHSLVGVMEAIYKIEQKDPSININLSEAYIAVCKCPSCGDNRGGIVKLEQYGVVDAECFPLDDYDKTRKEESCQRKCPDADERLWTIDGWKLFSAIQPKSVKEALICHGPLSVSSYNWGHNLVLVGYDDNNEMCRKFYGQWGCWILKNSFGNHEYKSMPSESGYIYIPYEGHKVSDIIQMVIYIYGVTPPDGFVA